MSADYSEPAGPVNVEEKIRRSVFIADLEPCHNEDEARNFLNRIVSLYRDATHHCRAYILGPDPEREYSSDDGEPSGTGGRPILSEIKRSGLVNVMIIVTRYFGGVKLGTRGLIDAYGGTAAKALSMVRPVQRMITKDFKISFDYASMGLMTRTLESHNAVNIQWHYGECVYVSASVPLGECDLFSLELEELKSRGFIHEQ